MNAKLSLPLVPLLIVAVAIVAIWKAGGATIGGGSAPIPSSGFAVLVLEETADRTKLPPEQAALFTDTNIRAYLNTHCIKGPDGKTPEFRFFDKDADVSHESALWQSAMTQAKAANLPTPTIAISTGKSGVIQALPANEADMLALLKKWGGP